MKNSFTCYAKLTPIALMLGLTFSLPLAAQNNSLYTFKIAQQSLTNALNQLAEQAQMNLVADAALLKGLQAPAIYGQKTLLDALQHTLKGTGISAEITDNNIIIRTNKPHQQSDIGATRADTKRNGNEQDGKENIEVIVVKGDQIHLKRDDIDRTRGNSNSNIFSTFTGIESNNLRNEAGALDIGIRGIQGEGRVPIFIDGSLQSTHTNRGYMGTADRTYIDSDLISTVNVEKGTSVKASPFGAGALGGTVNITTLTPLDILKPEQQVGALIKLKTYNNNSMPVVSDDAREQVYYQVRANPNVSDFENGGMVFASAFKSDHLSAVLAISDKKTGNYFAGSKGFEDFVEVKHGLSGSWEVLPPVYQGGEVVNTSFESTSYLAKLHYEFNKEHSIEVNTRSHRQKAGEMLAAYWFRVKAGDPIELADGSWDEVKEGEEAMPQWQPGTAKVNTISAGYNYLPAHNSLIDLQVNAWKTNATLKQYNALGTNFGPNALQYLHKYSNKRNGLAFYNTSSFKLADLIPTTVTAGYSWQTEQLSPEHGSEQYFYSGVPTSRNGKRTATSLFANAQFDFTEFEVMFNANTHNAKIDDYQLNSSQDFGTKTDLSAQLYYQLLNNTVFKAKYSQAYRMPSLFEATASNEVFRYAPEYPVGPERTNSYELGLKSQFGNLIDSGDSLTLSMNYFNNEIKNMLATANLPSPKPGAKSWERIYTFTNYDSFSLPGTEVKLDYKSHYIYASASMINYRNVEICSNELAAEAQTERCNNIGFAGSLTPLRIPPEKSYVVTLGSKLLDNSLDSGFIFKEHSEKRHPGGFLAGTAIDALEYIPEGYQVDFYIDYTYSENISAYMSITNLTDQYKVSTGSVVAMPEPGRTITLGLEIKL